MDWSKQNIIDFIHLIGERPAIWDIRCPEYKIRIKRHEAIDEVAAMMGITAKEVNTKWTVLRNQYSREKRRMIAIRRSGCSLSYMTKWYAYKEMEALMSANSPMQTSCKIEQNDDDDPLQTSSPSPNPMLPIHRSTISGGIYRQTKKREGDLKTLVYKEALKFMREKNNGRQILSDELTSYGLYIAAHLRKFPPLLQSKAKLEINNILYGLDMENLPQNGSVEENDRTIAFKMKDTS